jgi:transposase
MTLDQQIPGRRRRRTADEKRRIVEETLAPGTSVSVVARRHDVNANQLFAWRRQYQRGGLGNGASLIPVGIIGRDGSVSAASDLAKPKSVQLPGPPPVAADPKQSKMIEVELRSGTRIRIDADVRAAVLQRVLKMIRTLA